MIEICNFPNLFYNRKEKKSFSKKRFKHWKNKISINSLIRILTEQMESYKIEKDEQAVQIMQLKEYIAKQDSVTAKLNGLIKKLLQKDEEKQQHEHSLSAPKTDAKSNKYDNQERKKKDKQYLDEQQKLDLNEHIIAQYKKHSLKDQSASSKLPPIEDTKNKPIIVQVPKSQLKKINPQQLIEQMQKE